MALRTPIFGPKNDLIAWQGCARAVLIFAYGLALVRLSGRRAFGKWSALDIVVSIMVGSNLSRTLTGTLLATTVVMALHRILARLTAYWPVLSRVFEGRAVALASDGRLDSRTRHRHAVSQADLEEARHSASVARVEDTRRVMLEPSGKVIVLKKA